MGTPLPHDPHLPVTPLPPVEATGQFPPASAEAMTLPSSTASAEAGGAVSVAGYQILEELGRGGMGVVYKARQIQANRLVALKMILAGAGAGDSDRARFRTEAQAVARLTHPGIVQIFEVGEHDGRLFFSMEFCPGGSLETMLNGTPLPAHDAAELVETLARAMQSAHDAHVVHRDLKPANVLLSFSRDADVPRERSAPSAQGALRSEDSASRLNGVAPKITDFGLAKRLDEAGQTLSGAIVGTPSYMAPEQAEGRKDVGPAVDVYALGAILYECLTGRPPFRAATTFDTIHQVLFDEPVPPRQLARGVARDLETICLKCLHKEPARRYTTAAELAGDLARFRNNEPIRARRVSALERGVKWMRRRPAAAALAAVSVAAVLAVLAVSMAFNVRLEQEKRVALEQRDEADRQRREVELQRGRAHDNFLLARQVVDEYAKKAAEDPRLKERGVQEVRKEWLQAAEKFYQQFVAQAGDDPEVRLEQARAYSRLASISAEISTVQDAEKQYLKARQFWEKLIVDLPERVECQSELATIIAGLGNLAMARGQYPRAEKLLQEVHRMRVELARNHPQSPEHLSGLAASHNALALFYKETHQDALAEKELLTTLTLLGKMPPSDDKERDPLLLRAGVLVNLGGLYQSQQRYAETDAAYRQARELFEQRMKGAKLTFDHRKILAILLFTRAFFYHNTQRLVEAGKAYHETLAVLEPMAEEQPHLLEIQNMLAATLMAAGLDRYQRKQMREAAAFYDRASVIQDRLYRNYPDIKTYRTNRLSGLTALFALYFSTAQAEKCETTLDKSLAAARELVETDPNDLAMREKLADIHLNRRKLFEVTGRRDRAAAEFARELAVREEVARRSDAAIYKVHLADCVCNLGSFLQANKPAEKLRLYERGLGLLRDVLRNNPDHAGALDSLSITLANRADMLAEKRPGDALADRRESLPVLQRLIHVEPARAAAYRRSLATQHGKIGEHLVKLARPGEAESAYLQEVGVLDELVRDHRHDDEPAESRSRLAFAAARLARFLDHEMQGRAREAIPWYRKAILHHGWLALTDSDRVGRLISAGGEACNLAHLYNRKTTQSQHALAYYALAEWLLRIALAQKPDNDTGRLFLRNVCVGRAGLLLRLERFAEAIEDQQQVVAYCQARVAANKATAEDRLGLAQALYGLGILQRGAGRDGADALYAQAAAICEKLLDDVQHAGPARAQLAAVNHERAQLCGAAGKIKEAVNFLQRERRLREQSLKADPKNGAELQSLCETLELLAQMHVATKEMSKATQTQREATARRRELSNAYPNYLQGRVALAKACTLQGALEHHNNESAKAEASLQEACAVWEQLLKELPAEQARAYTAKAAMPYGALVHVRFLRRDYAGCEKPALRSIALWRQAIGATGGTAEIKVQLGGTLCNRGHCRTALNRLAEAIDDYNQAIALLGDVHAQDGTNASAREFLGNALSGRSSALVKQKKFAAALADCNRALDLASLGEQQNARRLERALILARRGDHAQAIAVAERMTRNDKIPPRTLYQGAAVYAQASAALRADEKLLRAGREKQAEAAALAALALLERSRQGGYFDSAERWKELREDDDLAPLRERRDFQAWVKKAGRP